MRVLIVGARGLIGSALVERLSMRHELVLGVRNLDQARARWPGVALQRLDYADPALAQQSALALAGVDAVVNAAGIFREQGSQRFDAIHVKGPQTLFDAAVRAGVHRIVQVSALGAHAHAPTRFLSSKAQADAFLARLPVASTVLRPSLVFAPEGASTRWFALLASLPVAPLPGGGRQRVQPVHLEDVCTAIERLFELPHPPPQLAAVGPEALQLRDYLARLRQALGLRGGVVAVPMPLARIAARVVGPFTGAPLDADALRMLQDDNVADPRPFAQVLGRPARAPENFMAPAQRAPMRTRALLDWTLPLLRGSLAVLWIVTGLVSLFAYPREASLALLARTGLHGAAADVALHGAALLDIALGAMLWVSAWRRLAYGAQIVLMLGYTLLISVFLPEQWAHPYGPVLKNLPLLAATLLLLMLDDSGRAQRRTQRLRMP